MSSEEMIMKAKMIVPALVIAIVVFAATLSNAQVRDETVLTWEVLTENWNDLIGGVLDLNDEEAEAFWPLYETYMSEVGAVWQQRIALIRQYLAHRTTMSAEEARQILADSMLARKKRVELDLKWSDVFDDVLPPQKVVRLFQAENKLETMMAMEIVRDVPLYQ
jgi:hypothetical protein